MSIKNCVYCEGDKFRLYGRDSNKNQRYQCLNPSCGKTFTEKTFEAKTVTLKKLVVLHLLLIGYGESRIAKKINLPEQTVLDWKRKFFLNLKIPRSKKLLNINEGFSILKSLQKGINPKAIQIKKYPPKKATKKK